VKNIDELQKRLCAAYICNPEFARTSPLMGSLAGMLTGKWATLAGHIEAIVKAGGIPDHDAVVKRLMDLPYDGPAAGAILPEEAMDLTAGKSEATVRGYEASILSWKAQQAALLAIQEGLSAVAAKGSLQDPGEAVAAMLERLRGVQSKAGGEVNIGNALREAVAESRLAAKNRAEGKTDASWGLPCLDAILPLERGRLYTLAAAPKCGKTSLAMMAAMATANMGGKVAFASLEMRAAELAQVLASRELGFDTRAFRKGTIGDDQLSDIECLAAEWEGKDHLLVRDTRNAVSSCSNIVAWVQQRQRMYGNLNLVVIDYLQLMTSSNPNKREYDIITDSTRMLKGLARDLNIPVLMLAQMNREGRRDQMNDGRKAGQVEPTLNALKGSGSIEQDSDAICFLWSEQEPTQTEAHRPVTFKVEASRFSEPGRAPLMFYGPQQLFSDASTHIEKPDTDRGAKLRSTPSNEEDLFNTAGENSR
jgi:replicative DNA helicase